jgi:hypothetical protein
VHPSSGKIDASLRVLNLDCRENEENKFKVQTCAGKVMVNVFWGSEGILFVEILKRCHNKFRAICAHIKVKTTNLKGSAKQEDESSPPA